MTVVYQAPLPTTWEVIPVSPPVAVVWDPYISQPYSCEWDGLITSWDDEGTEWDNGDTTWGDPATTWIG